MAYQTDRLEQSSLLLALLHLKCFQLGNLGEGIADSSLE